VRIFKNEEVGPLFMLFAALVGFLACNLGFFGSDLFAIKNQMWPFVSQIGMAMFFALIGFELRQEFSSGLFTSARSIFVPVSAALIGVILPGAAYIAVALFTSSSATVIAGWPMVTATDVSFALMVYTLLSKGLPLALRAFLLSFAVIDDIIATIALAVGFHRLDALTPLLSTAVAMVMAFVLTKRQVDTVVRSLGPVVSFIVLPVFAFFAMQIKFDANVTFIGAGAVLVPLILLRPLAKWAGVYFGAVLGNRLVGHRYRLPLDAIDFLKVASLSGIGFTVSLLAADLAFGTESALFASAASLTVVASLISVVLSAIALRARRVSK
jgi:NhaA family Na+:H+ antiporter